jgi:NitT/TauT family transport system ATP-binding protein
MLSSATDAGSRVESGLQQRRPHIVLKDVAKAYGKGNRALVAIDSLTLDIVRGEFLSILGPSGCGKSTLLMMMAGLVSPTRGLIEVNEKSVTKPLTDIGIAFQQDLLFDWRTAFGNVMLQADIRGLDRASARIKAQTLLERVGLKGFENRYPWELSGGMRQRVAICRALLHDASILLMDEPFGALDALTRDQMNQHLQNLWMDARPTAVMVTHSISEAVFLSDRVVVLSNRPARFAFELTIELPRPRTMEMRDTTAFVAFQRQLRQAIEPPQ